MTTHSDMSLLGTAMVEKSSVASNVRMGSMRTTLPLTWQWGRGPGQPHWEEGEGTG